MTTQLQAAVTAFSNLSTATLLAELPNCGTNFLMSDAIEAVLVKRHPEAYEAWVNFVPTDYDAPHPSLASFIG
jgi:hypothetical protein